MSISIFTGLIMFAKYWDCDPLVSGRISQPDELLPYYILDVARTVPGLPGLFIAGIFSAALRYSKCPKDDHSYLKSSTLSAVINCLCASIYEDFISRYVFKGTSERTVSNYLKVLAIIIGSITTILVYVVPYLGNLLPLAVSIGSVAGGTLLGLYTSAVLIPAINAKGALYGGIASIIFATWIIFCAQYYRSVKVITYPTLPVGINGCQNFTLANITTGQNPHLQ
ncbi:hypothetical protein AMK59_1134 [Oryctes borbonicus]|uniref:Uncharacterized protein n=1 Tax=Oryctes borbonicus TaxID=1629725 RepID=A0A0T6BA80_9SCAR|nr:hypothetical protein AMK59_1134 [Oryctes borbonicus]